MKLKEPLVYTSYSVAKRIGCVRCAARLFGIEHSLSKRLLGFGRYQICCSQCEYIMFYDLVHEIRYLRSGQLEKS